MVIEQSKQDTVRSGQFIFRASVGFGQTTHESEWFHLAGHLLILQQEMVTLMFSNNWCASFFWAVSVNLLLQIIAVEWQLYFQLNLQDFWTSSSILYFWSYTDPFYSVTWKWQDKLIAQISFSEAFQKYYSGSSKISLIRAACSRKGSFVEVVKYYLLEVVGLDSSSIDRDGETCLLVRSFNWKMGTEKTKVPNFL